MSASTPATPCVSSCPEPLIPERMAGTLRLEQVAEAARVEVLPPGADLAVAELGDADDKAGPHPAAVGPHEPVQALGEHHVVAAPDVAGLDVDVVHPERVD